MMWKNADWRWSECFFVPDTGSLAAPGVDASLLSPQWLEEPWNPYRNAEKNKEKLMELVCRVNGVKYEKGKKTKKIYLTVGNVKLSTQPSNMEVNFKLEEL